MKKITFLIVLFSLLSITKTFARKGVRITYGTVEKLVLVADLPNNEKYEIHEKADTGQDLTGYFDLAIKYSRFELLGMSLWINEEPVIVGKSTFYKDRYYNLTKEELNKILRENNLQKEKLLKLSLFDKYLGWIVFGGLFIIGRIWVAFFKKTKKTDDIEYNKNS